MHLLVPTRIMEIPASLLDPKVADLAAKYSVPVLLVARTIGQAVIAQTQVRGHPGFELSHQFRDVKYRPWEKPGIFWRRGRKMKMNVLGNRSHAFASQCQSDLRWGVV